jgi:hypothetical protein
VLIVLTVPLTTLISTVQTLVAGQRINVDLYHQRRSSGGALGKRRCRRRLRMPTHFPTGHDRAGSGVCPRSTRAKCLAVEHRPRRKDLGCGHSRLRARLGEQSEPQGVRLSPHLAKCVLGCDLVADEPQEIAAGCAHLLTAGVGYYEVPFEVPTSPPTITFRFANLPSGKRSKKPAPRDGYSLYQGSCRGVRSDRRMIGAIIRGPDRPSRGPHMTAAERIGPWASGMR